MNDFPHIGIAGNIGVGKTTLCQKLSEIFSLEPIYESVIDNPYLSDFYNAAPNFCLAGLQHIRQDLE